MWGLPLKRDGKLELQGPRILGSENGFPLPDLVGVSELRAEQRVNLTLPAPDAWLPSLLGPL